MSHRPTPVTDALLATQEAQDRYRGLDRTEGLVINTYACVVDIVHATERAGEDGLAALRDYLLSVDRDIEARFRREHERLCRTVEPHLVTSEDTL